MIDLSVVGGSGTFNWYSSSALTTNIGSGSTIAPLNILGTTAYYVTETVSGCQGAADSVLITITDCAQPVTDVVIPTAFTPNTDGVHDGWELVNIDTKYPDNIVYIYNRWGNLIFESVQGNYSNSKWDGTYKGKPMPVGSYYYIIYTSGDDTGEILKGTVTIIKN
jgi:gliding motility-associated-like protein